MLSSTSHLAHPIGLAAHNTAQPPLQSPHNTRVEPTYGTALHSHMLLRGSKSVLIVHNEQVYTLQATRLGKLILTK
jgi:hemin uptake protein HemP